MANNDYSPEIISIYDDVITPSGAGAQRSAAKTVGTANAAAAGKTTSGETKNTADTGTQKSKWAMGVDFFTDRRWRIVTGIIIIILAAFLFISVISYFFTAADDQSEVDGATLEQIVDTSGGEIRNIGGPGGAMLSHLFVTRGLGVGVIPIFIYMVLIGLALLGIRKCNFWSSTFKTLLLAVTLSMVFGLICFTREQIVPLGGYHGYFMNMLIIQRFSWLGAICVSLILVGCIAGVYFYDLVKFYNIIKKRWEANRERRRAAEEERKRILQATDTQLGNINDDTEEVIENISVEGAKTETKDHARELLEVLAKSDDSEVDKYEATDDVAKEETTDDVEKTDDDDKEVKDSEESVHDKEPEKRMDEGAEKKEPEIIEKIEEKEPVEDTDELKNEEKPVEEFKIKEGEKIEEAKKVEDTKLDPTAELSHYKMPTLDLLHDPGTPKESVDVAEIEDKKNQIIEALSKYRIGISKIEATVGPTVTMYEIVPAEGVKIATIKRLEEDIAMALAALSTRIIAPIPGKSAIGIEVPNREKQMVSVRKIFGSRAFQESNFELPIALGVTIDNQVYIADLAKMPHLLVAGATGKGKSVGMNVIINSLLYKKHPSELKLILVDPKMVEFHPYRRLENHYLAKVPDAENAIITDTSKVIDTLNSLCVEMDERYKLLQEAEVVKITHYNELYINKKLNPLKGHRFLPYIVVIVDEYADLVMTAGKEIETPIARLAQKARAVGMHVIIATQRPSANIITGIIKANFPARIAFKVSSHIDSKIILENSGANQLIGNGDMLISQDGELKRVQCAFISTDEIKEVAGHIGDQTGFGAPFLLPDPPAAAGKDGGGSGTVNGDWDPMLDEIARTIVNSGVASTSNIQRNFQIGYNRAGRIMDQLNALGVVGPQQGSKPRDVLVDMYRLEEILQQK